MAMKVLLALFALVVLSQAKHFYWFAGSTTTNTTGLTGTASPTANYVETFDGTTCTVGTVATGYQKFTINSTVGSFWYITVLYERAIYAGAVLQVYNGAFNPTTPCANIISFEDVGSFSAPHQTDLIWLGVGLYDVVITGDSLADNGWFAVHADSSFAQKVTTDADNWVRSPYDSQTSCSSFSSASPYAYFVFSPATTGYYDLFWWSYNATETTISATATLYNGTVTFLGTGNFSNPADPCVGQPWVRSDYGYSTYTDVSKSYYDSGSMIWQHLTAGVNYTIMVTSYYDEEINNYGVWWRPSIFFQLGDTANYYPPQPSFDAATDECTPDTDPHVWNSHVYLNPPTWSTVIVDYGTAPSPGFDEQTCLYMGINNGTKFSVAPSNCTGAYECRDSGSIAASGLNGQYYTVVETCYFDGISYAGDNYAIWVYSGVQLGPGLAPMTTTTGEVSSPAATQLVALVLLVIAMLF